MSLLTNPFLMRKLFQMAVAFGIVSFLLCPARSQTVAANTDAAPAAPEKKTEAVVFTEADRETALKELEETKDALFKEIKGLSEAQLAFREKADRWSIAEVAEHIITAEQALYGLITDKIMKAPVAAGKDNYRARDRAVWMAVTNRGTKFQAPEGVRPKGKYKTAAEIISSFGETRSKTAGFIRTTDADLRNRFADNPVMGVIDAYQWFIFLNAHSQRHLEQIREIKQHTDFPE